jgi:hypothetical protein
MGEYVDVLDQFEILENRRSQRAKENVQKRKVEAQKRIEERHEKKATLTRKHEEQKREQKVRQEVQERNKIQREKNLTLQKKLQEVNSLQKQTVLKNKANYSLSKKIQSGNNEEINSIIKYLRQNNLISNTDAFSFSLNNNELIVNGSRQPAELHKSLKEKYIHNPADLFNYSKNGSSTNITINKE